MLEEALEILEGENEHKILEEGQSYSPLDGGLTDNQQKPSMKMSRF